VRARRRPVRDELRPVAGVLVGLVLAVPFWVAFAALAFALAR
jgi:hypothetical protein